MRARCSPQPHRCAVVEDVDDILGDLNRVHKVTDGLREVLEGVLVLSSVRNLGEAVARQVGCDDVVLLRENGDEVAELEGRGGKAVKEENIGSLGVACLAVEDGNPVVDGDALDVSGWRCHYCLLIRVRCW